MLTREEFFDLQPGDLVQYVPEDGSKPPRTFVGCVVEVKPAETSDLWRRVRIAWSLPHAAWGTYSCADIERGGWDLIARGEP